MLHVFAQRHRIDLSRAIRGEVKLHARKLWQVFTVAVEEEIVALRIPRRVVRVAALRRYASQLSIRRTPNVDRRELVLVRHREYKIVAARRPDVITHLATTRVGDLGDFAIGERDDVNLAVLVAERETLPV